MGDERRRLGGAAGRPSARGLRLLALATLLVFAVERDAAGVLIEAGDGTGNVTAPPDDPGWLHVGTRNNLTVVYVGRRWVLTANHVGVGDVVIDGQIYSPVPGSAVQFENPDTSAVDLMAFKIFGDPGLPQLRIPRDPPSVGDAVTAIGHGRNRGAATTYLLMGGYNWGGGNSMRWGTNLVSEIDLEIDSTRSFATTFSDPADPDATPDEAAAANGDSGGASFIKIGDSWFLSGIIFSISQYIGQPSTTSIYGNETFSVDLSYYRGDILARIGQRSCSDGLDDDGDGWTDYPDDPECWGASDDSESVLGTPSVPALGPSARMLLVASMWFAARACARRRSR